MTAKSRSDSLSARACDRMIRCIDGALAARMDVRPAGGGWEYIAFLTAALLSIVALGDGRFSLDALILHGSAAFHRQIPGRVGRH
jgi:hypothetical protein